MSIDIVRPLKIECPAEGGTETDPFPTETDPTEDYVAAKGLAIEGLDTHTINRNGNDIQLTDPNNGTSKLKELRTAVNNIFNNSTNGFVATNVQTAIEEVNTKIKKVKAGLVTAGTFSGTPRKATITFTTAYADANYSITITGADSRSWTYESRTASGFVINSKANLALTGDVSWQSIYQGEN